MSDTPTLTVASYNMRKAVGLDRRRNPARVLQVLEEIDADVVALQEPDHPLTAPLRKLDFRNLGWHGNAILVKPHIAVTDVEALDLPTIEPRGAVMAELDVHGIALRVIGMHLDISGLRRRQQVLAILDHVERRHAKMPTIVMGDTNEWRANGASLAAFDERFEIAQCGPSFHSRKPVAELDRIIVDRRFAITESGVHVSDAARRASDHLPIWAKLSLAP